MADASVNPENSAVKDSNSDGVLQSCESNISDQQSQDQKVENLVSPINIQDSENSVKMDHYLLDTENLSSINVESAEEDVISNKVIDNVSEMTLISEKVSECTNNDLVINTNSESVLEGNSNESVEHTQSTEVNYNIMMREVIHKKDNYSDFVEYKNVRNTNLTNEINNSDRNEGLYYIDKQNSLAALALQYDSSDSENENSKIKNNIKDVNYRNKEIELSSDDSSDSESDSSSSDSESDSNSSNKKNNKSNESDSDDEDAQNQARSNKEKTTKVFKQKGEFDDLPPIEDLKISVPEVLCDPLGEIAWTVEQMVVVRPKPGKPTLNLDTILFIERGKRALGHIFDVFGQVTEPHYCVRFNSCEHIKECDIKVGMTVYYCPNTQYTSLVFLSELTKMKASDDVGEDEPPEFSDDEEEQAYLASLKNKPSNKPKDTSNDIPNKRRRNNKSGWQSNHPWNSNKDNNQQNPKPFYRSHHPWQRQKYHHHNQWNSFGQNRWGSPAPMEVYNNYFTPHSMQQMEMPRFPQVQWGSQYQFPPMNSMPGFSQAIAPPFTLPPPPPPPPPPPSSSSNADT